MAKIKEVLAISATSVAAGLGMYAVGSNQIDRHASQQADCLIARLPHADEKRCQDKIDTNFENVLLTVGGSVLMLLGGVTIVRTGVKIVDDGKNFDSEYTNSESESQPQVSKA